MILVFFQQMKCMFRDKLPMRRTETVKFLNKQDAHKHIQYIPWNDENVVQPKHLQWDKLDKKNLELVERRDYEFV